MVRIIVGLFLLFVSIFCVALYGAGSHGHFAFRPWMVEDWLIWGTALITGIAGTTSLIKTYIKSTKKFPKLKGNESHPDGLDIVSTTTFNQQELEVAHKHSIFHHAELQKSKVCGCFYCFHVFEPREILDWVDEENVRGATALCPKCGIDSVIGSYSGYPVSDLAFLKAINAYYF